MRTADEFVAAVARDHERPQKSRRPMDQIILLTNADKAQEPWVGMANAFAKDAFLDNFSVVESTVQNVSGM